jgi:TnpA family transposase
MAASSLTSRSNQNPTVIVQIPAGQQDDNEKGDKIQSIQAARFRLLVLSIILFCTILLGVQALVQETTPMEAVEETTGRASVLIPDGLH